MKLLPFFFSRVMTERKDVDTSNRRVSGGREKITCQQLQLPSKENEIAAVHQK